MVRKFIVMGVLAIMILGQSGTKAATPAQIQTAIDDGLAWLAGKQNPADGSWGHLYKKIGKTGLAVLKFEHEAIRLGYSSALDQGYHYRQNVEDGLNYLFKFATVAGTGEVSWAANTYETSIALMALSQCNTPNSTVNVIGSLVNGWSYYNVASAAVDWLINAQIVAGGNKGGWGYGYTSTVADQSNSGYATMALAMSESSAPYGFSIPIPQNTKDLLGDPVNWIDNIQDANGGSRYKLGSGYNWTNILETGNLIFEMNWYGDPLGTQRLIDALSYLDNNWYAYPGSGYPEGWIECYQAINGNGSWGPDYWDNHVGDYGAGLGDTILSTCWALMVLEKVTAPGKHNNLCDCIEFEYYPDTSPTQDNDIINLNYLSPYDITFWHSGVATAPLPGQYPRIAKVGSPKTGFSGPNAISSGCGIMAPTFDDMPLTDYHKFTKCSFLTDNGTGGVLPLDIMIEFIPPITEFYGELIDVDYNEWEIRAYEFVSGYVQTGNVVNVSSYPGSDGLPIPWLMATQRPFERLVISILPIYPGNNLSLDNLCFAAPSYVQIEAPLNCMLNSTQTVDIIVGDNCLCLGTFNFQITYDPSALTLVTVDPGSIYADYGWEDFSYWSPQVGDPICDAYGFVEIYGTADLPGIPGQPSRCILQPGDTYARLTFQITTDHTLECQFVPISFCWQNCSSNALGSGDGLDEYVSLAVYNYEYSDVNGPYNQRENITDHFASFENRGGTPNSCVPNIYNSPIRQRYVVYANGGVNIACMDAICGDVNGDDLVNILDIVFLINYKYKDGPAPEYLNAADVNGDTLVNILDIVYLINYKYKNGPGPICS